ncbi:MAG: hypothetical protein M3198_16745 [Actinomycetota bacterium]|nr:hypothetical protein [Actinomycetota bacterium]
MGAGVSSSIQRAGSWWNQAPDGTWHKWSQERAAWEAQTGPPPAPGAPPPPPPGPAAEAVEGQAVPAVASPAPEKKAPEAPSADTDRAPAPAGGADDTGSTSAARANAPLFSEASRRLSSPFESEKALGVVAAIVIVMVFLGTYVGATAFFRNAYGVDVALADEKASARDQFSKAKQAYIKRVDRRCASGRSAFDALEKKLLGVDSAAEMERLFDQLQDKINRQLDRWKAMKKPKEDRWLLERILKLHDGILPFLNRMRAALQSRDRTALETLAAEAYANAAKGQRLMEEYGFQVCGRV